MKVVLCSTCGATPTRCIPAEDPQHTMFECGNCGYRWSMMNPEEWAAPLTCEFRFVQAPLLVRWLPSRVREWIYDHIYDPLQLRGWLVDTGRDHAYIDFACAWPWSNRA